MPFKSLRKNTRVERSCITYALDYSLTQKKAVRTTKARIKQSGARDSINLLQFGKAYGEPRIQRLSHGKPLLRQHRRLLLRKGSWFESESAYLHSEVKACKIWLDNGLGVQRRDGAWAVVAMRNGRADTWSTLKECTFIYMQGKLTEIDWIICISV